MSLLEPTNAAISALESSQDRAHDKQVISDELLNQSAEEYAEAEIDNLNNDRIKEALQGYDTDKIQLVCTDNELSDALEFLEFRLNQYWKPILEQEYKDNKKDYS